MNIRNYIDGAFLDPVGGQFLDNIDPSTGNAYGLIPRSQAADVDLAVAAAKDAFPAWSSLSAAERSSWLMKVSNAIDAKLDTWHSPRAKTTASPSS